jgi:hypothetical protein
MTGGYGEAGVPVDQAVEGHCRVGEVFISILELELYGALPGKEEGVEFRAGVPLVEQDGEQFVGFWLGDLRRSGAEESQRYWPRRLLLKPATTGLVCLTFIREACLMRVKCTH